MAIGVRILSDNLSGETTNVTYFPDTGGTVDLGTQVFPFNYISSYYYGNYDCYVPTYGYNYVVNVPGPTPSPTATPTATQTGLTPTITSTPTETPTPSPTPSSTPNNTFTVTNNGASAYIINGDSNPTLNLLEGQTYTFNISANGHPFWIKTAPVTGFDDIYDDGVTNNGIQGGILTFTVPYDAPSTLYYICQIHGAMQGIINIIDVPTPTL